MSINLIALMKLGGILNVILSPLWAYFYKTIEPLEQRSIPDDPFWLISFYFCTTIFGFFYYTIATNPQKYIRFFPIAISAKLWGIFAIMYAFVYGSGWIPLAGLYDLFFLVIFTALYIQTIKNKRKNNAKN